MKIAVATQQGGLEDRVSGIVGRSPSFTIVETYNEEIIDSEILKNELDEAQTGAGVQAAQMLADEGIQAIIGGDFGAKIAREFRQSGIKMYRATGITAEEAVHQMIRGQLPEVQDGTGRGERGKGTRSRGPDRGQGGGTDLGERNPRR